MLSCFALLLFRTQEKLLVSLKTGVEKRPLRYLLFNFHDYFRPSIYGMVDSQCMVPLKKNKIFMPLTLKSELKF